MAHTQTIAVTNRDDDTVQHTAAPNETLRNMFRGAEAGQTYVSGVGEDGERDGSGEEFNAAAKVVVVETGGEGGVVEKAVGLES